ncbi:hypothetical protein MKW92_024015 [Papaver armeniacum]|nr:hypothetical protein MKW92_024015 [Papaver armeniacum]
MLIYWRSLEFKKKSENGKASRKRLVVPHHGGTKSFVNHATEAQMEALEREDLEENGSDNDVSILELTSYDRR